MPKTKISEFSATPANNTDIDSINIAEGCAPSGINDAIRELMAQLKDFQTGAQGDSFNGPIGTSTAAAGAFTTLSASSTTTLSGLTASTALALDASKNVVSVTNTGTGNNVLATSPTLVTPALGTPSALVGTNITGTASGLTAGNVTTNANLTGAVTSVGNATSLGSFTSANLLGALTDETGTGSAVFATSPTLVTPILGTPTSATLTNATGLPLTTGVTGTLPTANGGTNLTSFTSGGVVYASSSSALATGSALTFDGSNLGIAATVTGNSFTQYSNSADGGLIGFAGNAKALFGGSPPTSSLGVRGESNIVFGISSTEAMRLTSTLLYTASGINVAIGASSASSKLDVVRSSTATGAFDEPVMRAINTGAATLNQRVDIAMRWQDGTYNGIGGISMVRESATARSGSLVFLPIDSGGNGLAAMSLNSVGGLKTLSTIGVGGATPSTSGAGITFPATQSASSDANTLDDYEEGTWTPVGTWATQGTGTSINGGAANYYTKVGRKVTLLMYIVANKGTASGTFTVTGIPFAPATAAACAHRIAGMGAALQVVYVNITSTTMNFDLNDQGTTYGSSVTATQMSTECYIQVTCTYNI